MPGSMPGAQTSPTASAGTVPWHRDMAQANAASLISHRPVLVVFTATWSEASTTVKNTTLAAPEAAALLTACFEPVLVDVDAEPALTRSMGISNIPAACVVGANGQLLAKFDCPDRPAAFVAAAARAAQDAAAALPPAQATVATAARDGSDFTKQASPSVQPPASRDIPREPVAPAPDTFAQSGGVAADHDPALPPSPPAWPAESAARPNAWEGDSRTQTAGGPASATAFASPRQSLEPAPTAGTAPWLNGPGGSPQAQAAPAAPPASGAQPPATASPLAATEQKPEKKNPASSFFAALQKPFSVFSKPKENATYPETAAAKQPVNVAAAASTVPDAYGSMPLGLEGYCPVTLVDKGAWVEGRAQWGARHRGRTYLFAGAEQQKAFLADPDRYAPALSGDDPVLACDAGKQIAGQRRYGVTYQARTYLFSSPETRTTFAANPQRYTSRVMVAEQSTATIRR